MKHLYMIGGTMGVGKTTVSRILKYRLDRSAFLDGDWCWDMWPFQVMPETKKMVVNNIIFLLNSFLHCSAYENVVFCWVLHEQKIIDEILSGLDTSECEVHLISLVCGREALSKRLERDVEAGIRTADIIARSLERIPLYECLNTVKIDVSEISADQAAEMIASRCYGETA